MVVVHNEARAKILSDGKTSWERVVGSPYTGTLFPFGARADFLLEPDDRDKFEPRRAKGIATGYGKNETIEILDFEEYKSNGRYSFVYTRDYILTATEFPFWEITEDGHPEPGEMQFSGVSDEDPVLYVDTAGKQRCSTCRKLVGEGPVTCAFCLEERRHPKGRPPATCARSRCLGHRSGPKDNDEDDDDGAPKAPGQRTPRLRIQPWKGL